MAAWGGTEHSSFSSRRALTLRKTWPLKTANMSAFQDASSVAVICFVRKKRSICSSTYDLTCGGYKNQFSLKRNFRFPVVVRKNAVVASPSKDVCLVHLYWQARSQTFPQTWQFSLQWGKTFCCPHISGGEVYRMHRWRHENALKAEQGQKWCNSQLAMQRFNSRELNTHRPGNNNKGAQSYRVLGKIPPTWYAVNR